MKKERKEAEIENSVIDYGKFLAGIKRCTRIKIYIGDGMRSDIYQQIIENYVDAYNSFDIDRMLPDIHEDIKFENVSNGDRKYVSQSQFHYYNPGCYQKRI